MYVEPTKQRQKKSLLLPPNLRLKTPLKPRPRLLLRLGILLPLISPLLITPLAQILIALRLPHILPLLDGIEALLPLALRLALGGFLAFQRLFEERGVVADALAVRALLGVEPEVFLLDVGAFGLVHGGQAGFLGLCGAKGGGGVLAALFFGLVADVVEGWIGLLAVCEDHSAEGVAGIVVIVVGVVVVG